jgi:crossover junction endodeoxyribonuclease RuvC
MRLLGIDPGLRICGYAIIDADILGEKLIEAGTFRADPKLELAMRLDQIAADIDNILSSYEPDMMAVEELYSHYAHPRTAILMGHARGTIFQRAAAAHVPVKSFSATRIKKSITGNGRATKQQMQRSIQTLLALAQMPEPADVADAISIALCCANTLKIETDTMTDIRKSKF